MFTNYCTGCLTADYCLENGMCLRDNIENRFGLDENYGDIDQGSVAISELNVYGSEVALIRIKKKHLKDAILKGFSNDPELLSWYHISPGTLEHCVDHNYQNVVTAKNAEYFKVVYKKKDIGFVVTVPEPHLLLSFGINIRYRKKDILKKWLEALQELFNFSFFIVTLYPKNTRAIMFFVRNKFRFSITSENYIVLWQ